MIELIVIAIAVFFVWGSISDAKQVRKVQKSAENCKEKHEIITILKSVSATQVDNATCHLSVHSAGYKGVAEVIQVDIKLKSPELAPRFLLCDALQVLPQRIQRHRRGKALRPLRV